MSMVPIYWSGFGGFDSHRLNCVDALGPGYCHDRRVKWKDEWQLLDVSY
jgi:hypothetical protein